MTPADPGLRAGPGTAPSDVVPGPADRLVDDVGFLLARVSGALTRATDRTLAEVGLTSRRYATLALTADARGGITQSQLAAGLGLLPSQVVRLVDELTTARLVGREVSPSDRRVNHVKVTERGWAVRVEAAALIHRQQASTFGVLAAGERDQLRRLMQQLTGVVG